MRCLVALFLLMGVAFAQSQPEPQQKIQQAPNIQNSTDKSDAKIASPPIATVAPSANHPADSTAKKANKIVNTEPEGTEYWPWGRYKFKITDAALVAFTAALVIVGLFQACYLGRATHHFTISERAYVKMSHTEPGIVFTKDGKFIVQISVKNFGRTPARIEDTVIRPILLPVGDLLPRVPNYKRASGPSNKSFLVTNDELFAPSSFPIKIADFNAVKAGEIILYIIGYVDYIDIFGNVHRAGYGRIYDPRIDAGRPPKKRSNLIYFSGDFYNYDKRLSAQWWNIRRFF